MQQELTLSEQEMRALGYQAVDMLVNHFIRLSDKPVTRSKSRQELEQQFRESIPKKGTNPKQLLEELENHVFTNIMHVDHPRFFAFVSSPSNFIGVLADFLAIGHNVFAGTWLEASAPAQIELVTIDWLIEIFGLPQSTSGGLFVSGGSTANLTALILAIREKRKKKNNIAAIYASDQTHSCIERGIKLLAHDDVIYRKINSVNFKIDLSALRATIADDIKKGIQPLCIIGNAGTTNTGAIDDLFDIHAICQEENIWFHVDAAYGGAAILSTREKPQFKGIECADSIVIDPHKWFFQPYEIGCLLVRNQKKLKEAFYILPEYLKDTESHEEQINYSNYGIQLTRGFRALKLWLSLKTFGLDHMRSAIDHNIQLAKFAEMQVLQHPHWEVVSRAQIGILNFRYISKDLPLPELNAINQKLIDAVVHSGFAMISSTILHGKTVIRLCMINPRTSEEDISRTLALLNGLVQGEIS